LKGGKLDSVLKIAANKGTTITVKNLFFNVPARRKFLRSEPVEYKHILNYVHYQSVIFPNISFLLYHNGKEKLNYPATMTIENRMLDIFGTTFQNQKYIYIKKKAPFIGIRGYLQNIQPIENANLLDTHYIFVNNRYINDKTIYSAIKNAYEPFIKKYRYFEGGRLPNYILFIDLIPEEIDVNVHPAKTEIRLKNSSAVYGFVKDSIQESLIGKSDMQNQILNDNFKNVVSKHDISPNASANIISDSPTITEIASVSLPIKKNEKKSTGSHDYSKSILDNYFNIENSSPKVFEKSSLDQTSVKVDDIASFQIPQISTYINEILNTLKEDYIPLWQLHNTFIFVQIKDGFVAIDQHAAHERIIFEKLLKNIDNKKPNRQKLVFPLVLDLPNYLSDSLKNIITENEETLGNLGFVVRCFSGNSLVIDEIPSELGFWDGGNIFIEILEQLQNEMSEIKDFRIASAMSVACKSSIKAGKKLSKREMHELIYDLFKCDFPYQCPHGRPLIIKVTLRDLEKLFKRIT